MNTIKLNIWMHDDTSSWMHTARIDAAVRRVWSYIVNYCCKFTLLRKTRISYLYQLAFVLVRSRSEQRERERGSIYLQIGQQQSAVRTNHNIFNGKSVENFRRRTLKFNDVGQELWVPLHFPATQINFDGMQCASCRLAHTFYCVCKAKIYYYYLSSFQLAYKSVISIFLLLLPSYDANQLWNCIAIPFWHYEKWCRIAKKKKTEK